MRIKRFIVFDNELTVGYLAGTAAGRQRFEQIRDGAAAVAADLGLARVSRHLRMRSREVVRDSVDRAADLTCDTTADRLEALWTSADPDFRSLRDDAPEPTLSTWGRVNGSRHTNH